MFQQITDELLRAWARGDPRLLGALLVLSSLLMYSVAANLAWYYGPHHEHTVAARLARLLPGDLWRLLYELVRLTYYLGLPYVALLLGWIDVRALGLAFFDWVDSVRFTVVIALATWSLLMFVWVPYFRATSEVRLHVGREVLSWSRRVMEVVYMQAHWAFYRAACILLLTNFLKDDLAVYWGACAGLALVAIEVWSDPRVRRYVAHVGEGELILWSASQAIVNAVGFVLTRNAWLLILLHLMLEFTVPHLRPVAEPAPVQAPRPPALKPEAPPPPVARPEVRHPTPPMSRTGE